MADDFDVSPGGILIPRPPPPKPPPPVPERDPNDPCCYRCSAPLPTPSQLPGIGNPFHYTVGWHRHNYVCRCLGFGPNISWGHGGHLECPKCYKEQPLMGCTVCGCGDAYT